MKGKVVYVNTMYSLFLSLLLADNIDKNFYLFNDDFSPKVVKNIENKIIFKKYKQYSKLIRWIVIRSFLKKFLKKYRKKFEGKEFFIHDNLMYSQFLLNNLNNKFFLIEDGVINYTFLEDKIEEKRKENSILYRKTYLVKKIFSIMGVSSKIEKIYLTGIMPLPKSIENKVEIINIHYIWKNMLDIQKKKILKIFNIEFEMIESLKKIKDGILLMTQPLSEDKIITEEEKIEIYREILLKQNNKNLYIKSHPREKTDYGKIFKNFNVKIIENSFPIEILLLLDIKFDKVITLFSTGALNFKGRAKIEFIGTEKYYKLYKRFGKIEGE